MREPLTLLRGNRAEYGVFRDFRYDNNSTICSTLSTGLASKSFRVSASNALCLGDERVIAALFVGLGGIS